MAGRGFRGASANIAFTTSGLNSILKAGQSIDKMFNNMNKSANKFTSINDQITQTIIARQNAEQRIRSAQAESAVLAQKIQRAQAAGTNTARLNQMIERQNRYNLTVRQSTDEVARLTQSLTGLQRQAQQAMTGASSSAKGLLATLSGNPALFAGLIKGAALAGAALAAIKLSQWSADAALYAAQVERIEASFRGLIGSASDARKIVNDAFAVSLEFPIDPEGYLTGARTLLSVGADLSTLNAEMRTLATVSMAANQPLSDISLIYGEILTKNRLYREDLLQFSRRGIPIAQELAQALGVSRDELNKLVTDGKITFDVFRAGLELLAKSKFSALPEEILNTTQGKLDVMSNSLKNIKRDFGSIVLNITAPGISTLNDALKTMAARVNILRTAMEAARVMQLPKDDAAGYKLTSAEIERQRNLIKARNLELTKQGGTGRFAEKEMKRLAVLDKFLERQQELRIKLANDPLFSIDESGIIRSRAEIDANTKAIDELKDQINEIGPSEESIKKFEKIAEALKSSAESMEELRTDFDKIAKERGLTPDQISQYQSLMGLGSSDKASDLAARSSLKAITGEGASLATKDLEDFNLALNKLVQSGDLKAAGLLLDDMLKDVEKTVRESRGLFLGFNMADQYGLDEVTARSTKEFAKSNALYESAVNAFGSDSKEATEALKNLREVRERQLQDVQFERLNKLSTKSIESAPQYELRQALNDIMSQRDFMSEGVDVSLIAQAIKDGTEEFKSQTFSSAADLAAGVQQAVLKSDEDLTARDTLKTAEEIRDLMKGGASIDTLITAIQNMPGRVAR